MLENLKPAYNSFLRPAMRILAKCGVHPNHVTLFGVLLFVLAGWMCAVEHWYSATGFLVAGAFMDGIDGQLAREYGKKSVFGAILDSSCDRLTEIALLMGLLVYYMHNEVYGKWAVYLCFTTIASSVMVSYVKARCEGAGISCSRGIMQRPERIILFGIGLVAGTKAMVWVLLLITVFAIITVFERLLGASVACRQADQRPV